MFTEAPGSVDGLWIALSGPAAGRIAPLRRVQNSRAVADVLGSPARMSIRVHIGGRVCPPEEARVSVFDRGFLYGDSVYETIATASGRLFALAEHLTRLERSAARIGLRTPTRREMELAIADTVAAAGNRESRVRIMITRGVGKLDLDPASADD